MNISSAAFTEGGMIPKKYTCDDKNVSPPLTFGDIPAGAKSLALIADDPDAPVGTWVHWVMYNIQPSTNSLPENMPPEKVLSSGARHGINDFRYIGYGGPCPPGGTHRYFFKLYALDTILDLSPGASKKDLLGDMRNHILAEASLMGKYKRQR